MNESNFVRQRESDDSYCESSEQDYANYRSKNLPEGYQGYREPNELVYDRYDSDYEADETSEQPAKSNLLGSKKSCCEIGRLSMKSLSHL